jgi:hypothetical protein
LCQHSAPRKAENEAKYNLFFKTIQKLQEFKSTILGLSYVPKIDRKGKSITADPKKSITDPSTI